VHFATFSLDHAGKDPPDLETMYAKASILMSAFALEAAANSLVEALSDAAREDFDRLPVVAKFHLFMLGTGKGKKFNRGVVEIERIVELIKFRDNQVHSKPDVQPLLPNEKGEIRYPDVECTPQLRLPLRNFSIEAHHAATALQAVDSFLEMYLMKWCAFSLPDASQYLLHQSGITGGTSDSMATHLYQDIQPKFKRLGLRVKYLDPHEFTSTTGRQLHSQRKKAR
jgi:hypothetical protein